MGVISFIFHFQDSYIEEDIDTPIESLRRSDQFPDDDKIDFSLTVDPRIEVKAPIVSSLLISSLLGGIFLSRIIKKLCGYSVMKQADSAKMFSGLECFFSLVYS